jgi:hypothetical protein
MDKKENEILCQNCNFIFSDQTLYDIHLSKCQTNINNDIKNKYYCPLCDRKFRLLLNLQRHQETIKHIELLESNISQNQNQNQNLEPILDSKNIYVNLTPRRKELSIEDINNLKQKKENNLDFHELTETDNIEEMNHIKQTENTENTENEDDFLNNLKKKETPNLSNLLI